MLNQATAVATVAVKNLETAKKFYQDTLGLKPVDAQGEEVIVFQSSSGSTINVYHSQFAGTNKATAVAWRVGDDLEDVVQALKAKGVTFEHYDIPGMTREGDIHIADGLKAVWFKDPDGNIHTVVNQ